MKLSGSLLLSLVLPLWRASAFVLPPSVLGASKQDLVSSPQSTPSSAPLPLVIWHGLGDSFDADGIKQIADLAEEINPGTYVYAVRLGDTGDDDRTATFLGNLNDQVQQVCTQLALDPILSMAPAINTLGFSQGGQFLRAYVQRCNVPPVRNLVTFGSQHNGISKFQECASPTDLICQSANALLKLGTWTSWAQSRVVPAQYYRDPEDLDTYIEHSNFLADINNEKLARNRTYAANLASLHKFAMFMFSDDKTVHPKESAWFAEYNATSQLVTPLRDRPIYKEDWLGLKQLDEKNGLDFEVLKGQHMQFSDKTLSRVFERYFSADGDSSARTEL